MQVLRVRSTVAASQASTVLKSGDMLLAIAGAYRIDKTFLNCHYS